MLYCASCHGIEGDGKSLIAIDRPARSFIDGGFSFGNTIEALSKTTRSGIPGTPMPPFIEVLNDDQITLVAQYVQSFAPTAKAPTSDETEMVVVDRPVVVRGMLPPVQDELQLHPRGLMIGNPDGLSYEYRTDDVRLLAIRQGKFVQRTDWTGRGGTPLLPIGKIVVLVDGGNPSGMFETAQGVPLYAKLRSTSVAEPLGIVRYDLVDDEGIVHASVRETCSPTTGVRTLINQHLAIDASVPIRLNLPSSTQTLTILSMSPQANTGGQLFMQRWAHHDVACTYFVNSAHTTTSGLLDCRLFVASKQGSS